MRGYEDAVRGAVALHRCFIAGDLIDECCSCGWGLANFALMKRGT
jgi:hypothetical protein